MYSIRLRELRLRHGYTMEEVGKRIGIKKSSYASYEANYRQPPLDKLINLSNLYGVSVDYILGLTDEENKEAIQLKLIRACITNGCHCRQNQNPKDLHDLLKKVLQKEA